MSLVLVWLLIVESVPAHQQPTTPSSIKQSIAAMPPNARVLVEFTDGTRARGQVLNHSDDGFTLKVQKGQTQQIAYDQVRSVSQVKAAHAKRTKWIIIAVVVVAAIAIAAVVVVHQCGSICGG